MSVHCLAFTPCGEYLASGSQDGYVSFWDIAAGRPLGSIPSDCPVNSLSIDSTGRVFASVSSEQVDIFAIIN